MSGLPPNHIFFFSVSMCCTGSVRYVSPSLHLS